MSTQTSTTEIIETTGTAGMITEATGADTEYGDKRAELAPLLYELYAGRGAWEHLDTETQAHYVADADSVLQSLPHLLSAGERERLAALLPALAMSPEGIVTGERGTVEDHDRETLGCVCGNFSFFEGFIRATAEGIAVHVYATRKPEGLAAWPQDDELHTLCPKCGRLYRDETIRATNTAPVARSVDLRDGTPAAGALETYWLTSN